MIGHDLPELPCRELVELVTASGFDNVRLISLA